MVKAEVNGVDAVLRKLKFQEQKHPHTITVLVGYTASYALAVHEKVEMKLAGQPRQKPRKGYYWDPQGRAQAKFLETPARTESREISRITREVTKATGDFEKGLAFGGLHLQRESQLMVPVDEGNLKASAFTSIVRHGSEELFTGV